MATFDHSKLKMTTSPLKLSRPVKIIIAVAVGMLMFGTISIASRFREPPGFAWIGFLLLAVYYVIFEIIIKAQTYLFNRIKTKNESVRLFLVFIGSVLIGTSVYFVLFYIFKWIDHWSYGSETPMIGHMAMSVLMGLTISVIFTLVQMAVNWKNDHYQSNLENEQFQQEIAKANLAILKNQLDPHFMFNSFNTLYYLIDENSEMAKDFLKNISTIYRYILQNNDKSLIAVSEEHNLAKQYLAIMQQRYYNFLLVEDSIDAEDLQQKSVPPLVLQQLIENAIKHNRIDEGSPLNISFEVENNYIIVSNNVNLKRPEVTDQTGLSNIKKRYQYLTERPVVIAESQQQFTVSLPLINTADHE